MEVPINNVAVGALNTSIPRKKLKLIQSFRGLAALLVVLFHTTQLSNQKFHHSFISNIFSFGSAGVDFFFVLSGFIIFFVHRFDIGQKNKLKPFILKRFVRLYPMYWLVTLTLLPIYFLVPSFGKGYEQNADVIIKSLLLYPQQHEPILVVGWSLVYEVFFYLIFSLTIFLKPKYSKPIILFWLLGTLLKLILTATSPFKSNSVGINFIFNSYNLEFAFGCLSAHLVCKYKINQAGILLTTGIILFILGGICQDYNFINLNHIIAFGIPCMLIVIGAAWLDINKTVKVPNFLCYLGDASYSIYLIHYACLSVITKVAIAVNLEKFISHFWEMSLIVMLTLGLGLICYSYIEKPLIGFFRQRLVFN